MDNKIVNGANMSTVELVLVIVGCVFFAGVVLLAFVGSLTGKDLLVFERQKLASPKHYRHLKGVCRFNGPLVALMTVAFMAASPIIAMEDEGSALVAVGLFPFFAIFLWLSIRWFLWSIGALSAPAEKSAKNTDAQTR